MIFVEVIVLAKLLPFYSRIIFKKIDPNEQAV